MATVDDVRKMATDEAAKVLAAKQGAKPDVPAPTPTKPPAKPVAGGVAAPKAKAPAPTKIVTPEAKKALGMDDMLTRFDTNTSNIMDLNKQQLAEHPLPREQLNEFTPEQTREISTMTAMLMVMGALAGKRTMAPATAALNNMTGIMTGIKEGREDVYQKHITEYQQNFKVANENYNRVLDERRQIMESSKGDLKVEQERMKEFFLREGISEKYFKDQINHDNGMLRHKDAVQKQNDTVVNNILHPSMMVKGGTNELAKLRLQRNIELDKFPKRAAEINARFEADVNALRGGGAAAPAAAAPSGKPTPTQTDIAYVKAHPETKAAFVAHFGVEP